MKTISVCMITYNHAKYISEAIEGVLMQKGSFSIELIIGDDNSTDNTRIICESYSEKNPETVKLLPSLGKNIGADKNFIRVIKSCQSKYIALCEGDDFWTDPYKLMKQIQFLEENKNYSLCCHSYSIVDQNGAFISYPSADLEEKYPNGFEFDIVFFFQRWVTKTLTTVFRADSLSNEFFTHYKFRTDTVLFFNILKSQKGFWMNFNGGSYRRHNNGIWSSLNVRKKLETTLYVVNDLYQNNKMLTCLIDKKTKTLKLLIEHQLHDNNRDSIEYIKLIKYCYMFFLIEENKLETIKYINTLVVNKLTLRLKIFIRKKFDKTYQSKYYPNV